MPSWFLSLSLSLTRISYISILPSQNDARVRLFTCVLLYVCTYKYIVFPRTDKFYWVGFLRTSKNLYTVHLENTQIVNAPIGTQKETPAWKLRKDSRRGLIFFFFLTIEKLVFWSTGATCFEVGQRSVLYPPCIVEVPLESKLGRATWLGN